MSGTTTEPTTQAFTRARDYAAIFLHVGDRWREFVPVDGQVIDNRVYIQGVKLWRDGDVWRIGDGDGGHWAFRTASGGAW